MNDNKKVKSGFDFLDFVKNADRILKFAGRLFIFMLIVWILWAFRQAYQNDDYAFQPFGVPPNFVERGYSGEVVTEKIMTEMTTVLSSRLYDERNPDASKRVVARPELTFTEASRAGNFDLNSLFQVGKKILGKKDKTIKGYLTLDSNRVQLVVQMTDQAAYPLSIRRSESLDSLLHQAALHIIRQTTPQYLVYYFLGKQDFEKAEDLIQTIDFQLDSRPKTKTYDYERIQLELSRCNLSLAKNDFDGALQHAENLRQRYPKDIAGSVQTVNILAAKVIELENEGSEPAQIVALSQKAIEVAESIEKGGLGSIFLDKSKELGYLYANWAYLLEKIHAPDDKILAMYKRATQLIPQSSFAYNNLSYHYMDRKDYAAAEAALKKAVLANPKDGNTWDTYAELALLQRDTIHFYDYAERALQNQSPTHGITVEVYRTDKRWQGVAKEPRFLKLLEKYSNRKSD
jgi:tetratricopeptide (TPR) repeat protein